MGSVGEADLPARAVLTSIQAESRRPDYDKQVTRDYGGGAGEPESGSGTGEPGYADGRGRDAGKPRRRGRRGVEVPGRRGVGASG